MLDPELFGQAMADMVREIVDPLRREVADLRQKLAERQDVSTEIERQVKAAVDALPAPRNGRDFDPDLLRATVAEHVAKAVAEMPRPQDGKSADPADTVRLVAEAVAALPRPADGKSITVDDVRPVLDGAIKAMQEEMRQALDAAVKAIPAPRDGKDADIDVLRSMVADAVAAQPRPDDGKSVTVDDLMPAVRDAVAKAIAEMPKPADGVGVAGAMIDREGCLLVTLTNGEVKNLGAVVGRDGLSLDSFEMEYLPETHEVSIKATCAGRTKEIRFDAGGIRPADYWRDGTHSKACEAWSCDGSLWIAKRDTKTRPGPKSEDWVLAARKGRDGESVVRQLRDGPEPPIKLGGGGKK